jgi:hypothetical protein
MHVSPVIEQEFLPLRAKLLEIGAALDRLDRSGTLTSREPRVAKIRSAIEVLLGSDDDRAEQIQLVFSRPYEDDWRENLKISHD